MKGRAEFTSSEAAHIRHLLRLKAGADRDEQKRLRGKMRKIGFYISDFTDSVDGFLAQDFDTLVERGTVRITEEAG